MKIIHHGEDKLKKLVEGFVDGCAITAQTLGPHGRNVMVQGQFDYKIMNDGVRIINAMNFDDPIKNAGLWVAKNASAKTNDDVGDGTTTTVVLLKAIVEEALKRTESRAEIKRSLEEALPKAVKILMESAVPMKDEDIERVAFLISEHEDIARFMKEIYEKLGRDAAIQIEDSKTSETKYEIEDGYRLYDGYMSEWFFTDEKTRKAVLEDVPVIVATQKLSKNSDLMPIALQFKEAGVNQAVFFLQDIDDQMLGLLVKNHLQNNFKAIVVKTLPEYLEDIAAITGTKIVGEQSGYLWEKLKLKDLGYANKVVADKNATLIQSDAKAAQARALELQVNAADEPNMYRKSKLEERAARLRGKIAILKVGGHTELEREYRELKAEDCIRALPKAFDGGLVEGAGSALLKIS